MSLSYDHDTERNCLTLHIDDRFDFSLHRSFHDACLGERRAGSYVVDLDGATAMDSSALGMLLLLRDHAGGDSAEIRIVNASQDLRNTLRVAGFEKLFDVH